MCSLPESLSVISTVASAQQEMTIESLDVPDPAELDMKKNPHNPQGKRGIPFAILLPVKAQLAKNAKFWVRKIRRN